MKDQAWQTRAHSPFGLEVLTESRSTSAEEIPTQTLKEWIAKDRYVLLRGFDPLSTESMTHLALTTLGKRHSNGNFGTPSMSLWPNQTPKTISTPPAPFLFIGMGPLSGKSHTTVSSLVRSPRQPIAAAETIFCDGARLLAGATAEQRALWSTTSVTYSTDKVVHYGGAFTSPMIVPHPVSREETLRFAEPVLDLNPVTLEIPGRTPQQRDALVAEMAKLLRKSEYCVAHQWLAGDVLIADNHALLHGRNAFVHATLRHIRRINIL